MFRSHPRYLRETVSVIDSTLKTTSSDMTDVSQRRLHPCSALLKEFHSNPLTALSLLQVVVGAHAVMANGGVLAPVGLHMAALAAKRHAVPFVVLCGLHKVCASFLENKHIVVGMTMRL